MISRLLEAGYTGKVTKTVTLKNAEITAICLAAREVFLSQPTLIELSPPVKIVGDVHGQYSDLIRMFEMCGFPPSANFLFLGDYVDRGKQSLETILLVSSCLLPFSTRKAGYFVLDLHLKQAFLAFPLRRIPSIFPHSSSATRSSTPKTSSFSEATTKPQTLLASTAFTTSASVAATSRFGKDSVRLHPSSSSPPCSLYLFLPSYSSYPSA
jgi:hypothetical protein